MIIDLIDLLQAKVIGYVDHQTSCGSCAKCGMWIRYATIIQLPDGSSHEVGDECALKIGGEVSARSQKMIDNRKLAAKQAKEAGRFGIIDRYKQSTLLKHNDKFYQIPKAVCAVWGYCNAYSLSQGSHLEPYCHYYVYYSGIHQEFFVIPSGCKFTKSLKAVWSDKLVLFPVDYKPSMEEMRTLSCK